MKLVSGRRSVRKYKAAPVEREKLEFCLEAARLAPPARKPPAMPGKPAEAGPTPAPEPPSMADRLRALGVRFR